LADRRSLSPRPGCAEKRERASGKLRSHRSLRGRSTASEFIAQVAAGAPRR
jgi:hypothetical protein